MDHSPFAKLPAELRNEIWSYAFTDSNSIGIAFPEPGLLRTCNRVRNEAREMYYVHNSFKLSVPAPVQYRLSTENFLVVMGHGMHEAATIENLAQARLEKMLPITVICKAATPVSEASQWQFAEKQVDLVSKTFADRGLGTNDVFWALEWPADTPDIVRGYTKEVCTGRWMHELKLNFARAIESDRHQ